MAARDVAQHQRLLVGLACALRADAEEGWNEAFLERCAAALGCAGARPACGWRPLYDTASVDEATWVDAPAELVARLVVSEIVEQGGEYDARARVAFRRCSAELVAVERAVARALCGAPAQDARQQQQHASALKYAKIGAAAVTAGAAVAFTAGLAAPVLAAYRMRRRVAGLTDFALFPDDGDDALAVAFCVPGFLRDDADYAATFGLARLPADAPLALRLRRCLAFHRLFHSVDADALLEDVVSAVQPPAARDAVLAARLGLATLDVSPPPADPLSPEVEQACAAALARVRDSTESFAGHQEALDDLVAQRLAAAAAARATRCTTADDDAVQPVETLSRQFARLFAAAAAATGEDDDDEEDEEDENLSSPRPGDDVQREEPVWFWRSQTKGPTAGTLAVAVAWERALLVEVGRSMAAMAASWAASGAQEAVVLGASTTAAAVVLSTLALPIALIRATKYIDATWTIAVERADAAGVALADALCARRQLGARPATLVGFSLGARVVFKCLQELARRHREQRQRRRAVACVALDGVHWLSGGPWQRLRVCVRVVGQAAVQDASGPRRAQAGEPILWSNDHSAARAVLPAASAVEVSLVNDGPLAGAARRLGRTVLASAVFDDWLDDGVHGATKKLAPLCEARTGAVVAAVKLQLRPFHDDDDERDSYAGIVEHAVLLGAPVRGPAWSNADHHIWKACAAVVAGHFVNAYSKNDLMLALCYRSQSWAAKITGLHPVNLPGAVTDVDVSPVVASHRDYARNVDALLALVFSEDGVLTTPPSSGQHRNLCTEE